MSKFKVGDRVRVTDAKLLHRGTPIGAMGTITEIEGKAVYFELEHPECGKIMQMLCDPEEFLELVPVAEATGTDAEPKVGKPKFKVGDRFRRIGNEGEREPNFQIGFESTVKSLHGDYIRDEDDYGHSIDNIVSLPTTLTIQPGKFYITSDGRKVGPMRRWHDFCGYPWEADDDDLPYIWADDGTEIDSDIDDSADLVAEASSSDNGSTDYGSTAGFTVPVFDEDDKSASSDAPIACIADIVRRLERLEAAASIDESAAFRIGDKVTLRATVTGKQKKTRVNITLDDVSGAAHSIVVPAAALTAA